MGLERTITNNRTPHGRPSPMTPTGRRGWSGSWKAAAPAAAGCWRDGPSCAACSKRAGAGSHPRSSRPCACSANSPSMAVIRSRCCAVSASHTIKRQHKNAFEELKCDMFDHVLPAYERTLRARGVEEMRPKNATAARELLLGMVDRATGRLNKLAAEHQALAERLAPTANRHPGVRPRHGRRAAATASRSTATG